MDLNSTKSYWMLISNPNKWFGENAIENKNVNEILSILGDETDVYEFELWKLNTSPSMKMDQKIKEHDEGILKIGNDNRSSLIIDKIPKLKSGIYGVFKFVSTPYNSKNPKKHIDPTNKEEFSQISSMLWTNEAGEIFGKIKVIDNFFSKNKIILKADAIEQMLSKNLFESHGSREIPKKVYEKIVNYASNL